MKNATVSRRYARALYALANESKSLDDVLTGLGNIRHALETTPELRQIFFNPTITPAAKRKLITTITSNKLIGKFIEVLAQRKRLNLIDDIFEILSGLSDASHHIVRPLIKTATPLTDDQKRGVEQALAKSTGGKVLGQFAVDKDLIGGVWVKLGDKVLEATLRGRLNMFRQAMLHSVN